MIEVKSLCKTYLVKNQIIQALHHIDLSIPVGEIFGVIGESGSGKSTFLRTLNYLEKPTSGQILVQGADLALLSAMELRKIRHRMGMIFQSFNLLESRTALENIAFPLELMGQAKNKTRQTAQALLDWVGLKDYKNHYPSQLSGGQKQRIAIARALATDPTILLCDEPTSALDPKSTYAILNLLKRINQQLGVTIVFITHEMDAIKHICHRAAVFDKGHLIEQGTVVELFTQAKSSVTQQLIQKFLHIELPDMVKNKMSLGDSFGKSYIVRFTFVGNDSSQPLISALITTFSLTINLIQASIENIQDTTVGFTVCQISGDHDNIQQALDYVKNTSVIAEVLGYV